MEWQPPRSIKQAPLENGRHYGPCLLSPGINGSDWTIGDYDGEGNWWTLDGEYRLDPTHYLLLPPRSVLDS